MALTTYRSVNLVYRSVDPLVYSSDDRTRRAAINKPWRWNIDVILAEGNMIDPAMSDDALREAHRERLEQTTIDHNRDYPTDQPRYVFKLLVATFYNYDGYSQTINQWQRREQSRIEQGAYLFPPWQAAPWYEPFMYLHYAHLSLKQPGKIAFTQTEAHGEADRQTIISPGKYLMRYFGEWVNQAAVDTYCATIDAETKLLDTPVQFASSPEDILHVYQNGPSSCMTHDDDSDEYSTGGIHPVTVYGAGDLAIAYFRGEDYGIKARAISWPEKKIYGRVYGDENRLKPLLARLGFSFVPSQNAHLWNGARLLKKPVGGDKNFGYVCPYLDIANQRVNIAAKHLIIHADGDYVAGNIASVIAGDGIGGEDNEGTFTCDGCNGRFDEDHGNSSDDGCCYCSDCYSERFYQCDLCETETGRDDAWTVNYRGGHEATLCRDCRDENTTACGWCDNRWITDSRRPRMNAEFVKSIFHTEDEAHGYCPDCVSDSSVLRRPCGHYAAPTDHNTCECGAPELVSVVITPLRIHRVGA